MVTQRASAYEDQPSRRKRRPSVYTSSTGERLRQMWMPEANSGSRREKDSMTSQSS